MAIKRMTSGIIQTCFYNMRIKYDTTILLTKKDQSSEMHCSDLFS